MSTYRNCKRSWETIDGKKIWFSSLSEYRYYLYLRFLKQHKEIKDFVYQPKSFDMSKWYKHGTNQYRLDFEIIRLDKTKYYIEIKSTDNLLKMDAKSRTKIKRFKKHFPELELQIISTKNIARLNLIWIKEWK